MIKDTTPNQNGATPRDKLSNTPIAEDLVKARKKQHEIIQQLSAMLGNLNGAPMPEEAEQEWRGLVELAKQIADDNDAIARLVKECRELIGV